MTTTVPADVQALAGSIQLQGMLVPVVVRSDGDGFELIAGFHRIAAAQSLGLADVPVVVRDGETEDADRAIEDITRRQLNPTTRPMPCGRCSTAALPKTAPRRRSAGPSSA